MATDIEVMVRDLYRAVDTGQDRVNANDVVAGRVVAAAQVRDSSRRLRLAGWPVAAVAVLVVLLVGAVTVLMMSGGGTDMTDSPSGPVTTPTTAAPQTTTTAPTAATTTVATVPSSDGEDSISTTELPPPGTTATIVEGTDSFVVETETLGPLRWTRFEIQAGDTPPFVSVDPLGGYLAHGIAGGELGVWSDTVMHSGDGTSWRILTGEEATAAASRVEVSNPQPETETLPGQVGEPGRGAASQGNFGFFAYGDTSDCCETPGSQSAAWVSADGRTWERIGLPPDTGYAGGVGAVGDIIFIASDKHDEDGVHPMVLWIGTLATAGDVPIVGSVHVGSETSVGMLEWTRIVGPANSCPPTVRVDVERGGYHSTWCKGGALHSDDGIEWTALPDFPDFDTNPDAHMPNPLGPEPPTAPVSFQRAEEGVTQTLFFSETDFGWVASQPDLASAEPRPPRIWISTDGYEWEEVDSPPMPDTEGRRVWSGRGGGAGDLLYFGYVTSDYLDGNFLWIGHFSRA